jgi:predicted Zn-dependent protease
MSFAGLTGYQIDVVRQLALKTETVSTSGSSSDPWTKVIENGFTAEQMLRLISAVLIGKTQIVPGAPGEATVYFRDIADTKDRVGAAMVGSERTGIALDAT